MQITRSWPYRDELLRGVRRYELGELLRFPALLYEADRSLKSRSIGGRAVLENLVDRMTRPAGGDVR